MRWGFDAAHRSSFQLEGIAPNTWQSGLDRILLGVTMADEHQRLFGGTLPLDDVDSADIDLAGRLSEFLDRLRAALDTLAGTRTVDEWANALAQISDSLTDDFGRRRLAEGRSSAHCSTSWWSEATHRGRHQRGHPQL